MANLITFVCLGNICRSPMGEQIAREWARRAGVDVRFDSAGTSDEEVGNPIDPRAARVLRQHGYPVGNHRAKQISRDLISRSTLVLAFEQSHLSRLSRLAPQAANLTLVTDFDPDADRGSGIPDPWFHGPAAFDATLVAIEAAMPGLLDTIRNTGD